MNALKLREELLQAFAKMDARDQARSEERGTRSENSQPSTELPFEPDPQHSCLPVEGQKDQPAKIINRKSYILNPTSLSPAPCPPSPIMETDPVLIGAFFNKYPNATSIRVLRGTLWERGSRQPRALPIEVWVALPTGSVIIEKRRTTEELLAIAEAR